MTADPIAPIESSSEERLAALWALGRVPRLSNNLTLALRSRAPRHPTSPLYSGRWETAYQQWKYWSHHPGAELRLPVAKAFPSAAPQRMY